MEFNPHFCLTILWGPQPDGYQAELSGHSKFSKILPFLWVFIASGNIGLRYKMSRCARRCMLNSLYFKDLVSFN